MGNKLSSEITENNGSIEKEHPRRGRKRQLKFLDFIWQQGTPAGDTTNRTRQNQEEDEAQGIIHPKWTKLGPKP